MRQRVPHCDGAFPDHEVYCVCWHTSTETFGILPFGSKFDKLCTVSVPSAIKLNLICTSLIASTWQTVVYSIHSYGVFQLLEDSNVCGFSGACSALCGTAYQDQTFGVVHLHFPVESVGHSISLLSHVVIGAVWTVFR